MSSVPNLNATTINPALATPKTEQPASEWASSTLSALDHKEVNRNQNTFESASAATTPGFDVPGAFPGERPHPGTVQQDVQSAKDAAWSALETARGYAASAATTAGETVGGYLPQSVSAYLPGSTPQGSKLVQGQTLPSEETSQNEHPASSGGAGTLPGPPGELGVAVLPDERTGGKSVDQAVKDSIASANVIKSSPITTTTNNSTTQPIAQPTSAPLNSASNNGGIPETMRDEVGIAKLPEERRQENLPSHDDQNPSRLGKTSGVGALPGSANEAGVATLPDERAASIHNLGSTTSDGASADASTKSLAGSRYEAPAHDAHPPPVGTKNPFTAVGATGVAEKVKEKVKPDFAHHPDETKPAQADQIHLDREPHTLEQAKPDLSRHHDEVKSNQVGQLHLNSSPQTEGRDHVLAKDESKKLGSHGLEHDGVTTDLPGSATSESRRPVQQTFSSSAATPGHDGYAPEVPHKDRVGHMGPSRGVASSSPDAHDRSIGIGAGGMSTSATKAPTTANDTHGSGTGGSSPPKKAGFMDKLKGEVKVLSGKLSSNEEKVDEGRKMMGKN